MKKRILSVIAAVLGVTMLTGCSLFGSQSTNAMGSYDFTQMDLIQLDKPAEGQDVAVIETNVGTMTAVLYT